MKPTYEQLEALAAEQDALLLSYAKIAGSKAAKVQQLEAQVKHLAAENARLKSAAEFATAPDMWVEQANGMLEYRYHEWYVDILKAAMETPATDAYLSQLRNDAQAEGVEILRDHAAIKFCSLTHACDEVARQLREGKAGEVCGE